MLIECNIKNSAKIVYFTHFTRSLHARPQKAIDYLESRNLNYKLLPVGYDAGTLHKVKEITAAQKQEWVIMFYRAGGLTGNPGV